MKNLSIAVITALTVLFGSAFAPAQTAVYKYEVGKPYKYMLEFKRDVIQEMMGETMNITVEGTGSGTYSNTKTLENGNMLMSLTVESALVLVESPQGTQTFGDALKGKEYRYTIKPNGEIVDRDTTIEMPQDGSAQLLGELIGAFRTLDASKLKIGESWTRERADTSGDADSKMIRSGKSKYEVKGTKEAAARNCLEISVHTDMETDGRVSRGGNDLRVTGEETHDGSLLYDPAGGIIIEININEKGEQVITPVDGGQFKVNVSSSGSRKVEYIPDAK